MLGGKAKHWWRMENRLLESHEPLVWEKYKDAFFKKYFPRSVRCQKESKFIQLRQVNMTVAEYETKFPQLSRFSFDLISTEKCKAFRFQEGLSPFLKDKLSLHKLETYSEVVESAFLIEIRAKELQKYREQHKRGRSGCPQCV